MATEGPFTLVGADQTTNAGQPDWTPTNIGRDVGGLNVNGDNEPTVTLTGTQTSEIITASFAGQFPLTQAALDAGGSLVGITVSLVCSRSGVGSATGDDGYAAVGPGGFGIGNEKTFVVPSSGTATLGGPTDLWGRTVADWQTSGVASIVCGLAAVKVGGGSLVYIYDYLTMTLTYNVVSPRVPTGGVGVGGDIVATGTYVETNVSYRKIGRGLDGYIGGGLG